MNLLRCLLLFVFLLAELSAAWACAICAPAPEQPTLRQQLRAADVVVLARLAPAAGTYSVVHLIKGDLPKGPIRLAVAPSDAQFRSSPDEALLYRLGDAGWQRAGALSAARADWVRQLMALPDPVDPAPAQWLARLGFFVAGLEDPQALLAEVAYAEMASAPYASLRVMAPRLDASRLMLWLDRPELKMRRPLYALLLGFVGQSAAASFLQQRMAGLRDPADMPSLSAMLAALIEIQGADGVQWLERHYLSGPLNRDELVPASLLALSVHGSDGQRVSQARVVQAYRYFVDQPTALAGLVASDLGNWSRWEFAPAFVHWLRSGRPQSFASRYAMVFYLMRSPRADARSALESLRAEGLL